MFPFLESKYLALNFCKMSKGVELHNCCSYIGIYCLSIVLFIYRLIVLSVVYTISVQESQKRFSLKLT